MVQSLITRHGSRFNKHADFPGHATKIGGFFLFSLAHNMIANVNAQILQFLITFANNTIVVQVNHANRQSDIVLSRRRARLSVPSLVVVLGSMSVARGVSLVPALLPSVTDATEAGAKASISWCVWIFGDAEVSCQRDSE